MGADNVIFFNLQMYKKNIVVEKSELNLHFENLLTIFEAN